MGIPARARRRDHRRARRALRRDLRRLGARAAPPSRAPDLRVKLIARHGVGFDAVDVPAMTARGVLVTNTPDAVRRPVATAALTLVLALAHKLLIKDRLTRAGTLERAHRATWARASPAARSASSAPAASAARRCASRACSTCGCSPPTRMPMPREIAALGATLVPLDTLLAEADFVCVTCAADARDAAPDRRPRARADAPLRVSDQRRARADRRRSRAASRRSLRGHIAGAALDVFETEPVAGRHPLLRCPTSSSRRTRCAGPTSASPRSPTAGSAAWSTSRSGARRRSSSTAAFSRTRACGRGSADDRARRRASSQPLFGPRTARSTRRRASRRARRRRFPCRAPRCAARSSAPSAARASDEPRLTRLTPRSCELGERERRAGEAHERRSPAWARRRARPTRWLRGS